MKIKIPIVVTIALWLVLLFFVSIFLRDEFSHTYLHWIKGLELPFLTRGLSAPVLGIPQVSGATARHTAWLFWGVLWLAPVILAVAVIRAPDEQAAFRIWVSWGPLYAIAVLLAFFLVIVGLWLPFSLL